MKIQKNKKLMQTLDQIAMERSISDEDNYQILHLLNSGDPTVRFQNCETFQAAPFDRCKNPDDKRKMMASILTMGAARNIQKFSAVNIAQNIDLVMDLYQNMEEFDQDIFQNDPYLSHVALPMYYDESFVFSFHSYEKNRLFYFDSPVEKGYHDILRLGYFRENENYPYITRNGNYFAEISVHEIISAKRMISPLSGNVLITGLSIGYMPYLAHLKDSVTSVTIIEEDETIISLFLKEILPQFIHPEKIRVIHKNIDGFMKEWDQEYDCVIFDHYNDSLIGTKEYLKLKPFEKLHKKTKFFYQIEDSILTNIKSSLLYACIAEMMEDAEMYKGISDDPASKEVFDAVETVMDRYALQGTKDLQKLFQNKELKKIILKEM